LQSVPGAFSYGFPLLAMQGLTAPLPMAALALLRRQRAAALAAVALLTWLVYVTGWPGWSMPYGTADAYILLALGLQKSRRGRITGIAPRTADPDLEARCVHSHHRAGGQHHCLSGDSDRANRDLRCHGTGFPPAAR